MLRNLTPHPITIEDGGRITIAPEGVSARISYGGGYGAGAEHAGTGVTVVERPLAGTITGLPEPEDGVTFIASLPVAQAAGLAGRTDVVSPGTGPEDGAIREGGVVIAVTQLVRWTAPAPAPVVATANSTDAVEFAPETTSFAREAEEQHRERRARLGPYAR